MSTASLAVNIGIPLMSLGGLALSFSRLLQVRRWAPVIGLGAQPFWMWHGLSVEAAGIVVTATAYAAVNGYGIYHLWSRAPD